MIDREHSIGSQRSSHEDLIEMASPRGRPISADARLDAIIVPASRPARNITTAIELAKAADCHLVVLCSMDARPEKVRSLFASKGFLKGTATDVPRSYQIPDLRLETASWMTEHRATICGGRDSDLSLKRNIGLLIARMLDWHRIFFMDDDIRGIYADEVVRTASLLGTGGRKYRSSGIQIDYFQTSNSQENSFRSSSMQVKYFPDNSVVCHARRMVGLDQDVFVSGSVLAVDCNSQFDFFPDVYNEDWLFFYRDAAEHKLASPGLQATQMHQEKYNPFADPQRAAKEEFGDVIAEGLYSLLHYPDFGSHSPTGAYWELFLANRKRVLEDVSKQLFKAPPEQRGEIDKAIMVALDTLEKITPEMCVDYLAAWQRDLRRWADIRDSLLKKDSVSDALGVLKLLP
jgi:hypothetical protein